MNPNLSDRSTSPTTVGLQVALFRSCQALTAYVARQLPAALASAVDPADVVHDVYLEAMRRSTEFRPNDELHSLRWLKTIARHRIIDLLRHYEAKKRGGGASGTAASGQPLPDASAPTLSLLEQVAVYYRTPSQSAASHEIADLVRREIATLPADYATVLQLRVFEGLSGKLTADRLARTEVAAQALYGRAITALGERLRSTLPMG
jgi:RNA polymerase sigma factor (sigma-70 family)